MISPFSLVSTFSKVAWPAEISSIQEAGGDYSVIERTLSDILDRELPKIREEATEWARLEALGDVDCANARLSDFLGKRLSHAISGIITTEIESHKSRVSEQLGEL